jgi:NADH-quinone oxidoreductase subunit F
MTKVETVEQFGNLRRLLAARDGEGKPCLVICAGTGGQASGSNDIVRVIKRHIVQRGLNDELSLRLTGCLGFCEMDPFILVEPGGQLYPKLDMGDVPRIIDAVLQGEVVQDLLYREPGTGRLHVCQDEIPFFAGQTRTILGDNQFVDPIRIVDYLERGGYAALEKILADPDPDWIVEEVTRSGLRGRGGAGFPAGVKWGLARKSPGTQKFVVCNADEGDPGAYMDRSLLEGNPHAILEGMTIAGIAMGATQGIVYVRSEYPLAIKHTTIAIRQSREMGLLGADILGTGIDFDVEIVQGAGAFVCGEETALIKSIEGLMGEPVQRPPYPITRGISGAPTCINNVETLANVPVVISGGADAYSKVGTPGNTGTKIFSLVGKVKNTGLVEVPLGTPIHRVVHDIGGGASGTAKIKAVQTGGPSGGCIPASMFDLPIDYDSLRGAGSIMGSGGMIVMDDDTCMVDVARYFMGFLKEESCGKCFPCRKGTQRMYELLDDITKGKGTLKHLDLLEELAITVRDTTMCGLGQSAPNPVLSTLRYYRHEYERHIIDKRCDAFVCKDLVGAQCSRACPVGTEAWRYVAHIERGETELAYQVIRSANPFPSVCSRVCNHPCEDRCRAGVGDGDPIAIRALKRYVTDQVDPASWEPRFAPLKDAAVAVVGAGPAGLSAAHYLSLQGHEVTVFEAGPEPGGMLFWTIPEYRLPRDVLRREIDALLNDRITLKCDTRLGVDLSIDDLFEQGFQAVFVAVGSHRSKKLQIDGEDVEGVWSSMEFLKGACVGGKNLGRGHVGIVGGGNSAVDAARVAVRQPDVESVTIFYRRTQQEMPAFAEEVRDAVEEGITFEMLVSPTAVRSEDGRLVGLTCLRNELGALDASGRRRPVPVEGSEFTAPLDTLVVAISEEPETGALVTIGTESWGGVKTDRDTFVTNRPGVLAGGDAVTGPNTVIDAIAHGKNAARVIGRYLQGAELREPSTAPVPKHYVAPSGNPEPVPDSRLEPPRASAEWRRRSFAEIEASLSFHEARREASRCLRCDLEFTRPPDGEVLVRDPEGAVK